MISGRKFTLGQFAPRDSVIHHLDPRTKILGIFIMMCVLLFTHRPEILLFYFCVIVGLFRISRLQIGLALKNIKPFIWLFLITFLLHLLLTKGRILFTIPTLNISITQEGIQQGFYYTFRIAVLIILASFLTLTTSAMSLTDGLERFMRPFRKIGLPAHEIAMMLSISLRFIPILMDETERIRNAQLSRGASFEGHLIQKIRSIVPMIIPLFLSAFRRANDLALAMDARCYQGGEGRTNFRILVFKRNDTIAFMILGISILPLFLLK